MLMEPIERVCILGGGTAGWMTAAALSRKLRGLPVSIELIESDAIGTVGVGEATLPHIREFNRVLGIDEAAFMKATQATFKLGIEFCNWGRIGDRYIHPFGTYGRDVEGIEFHHIWRRLRDTEDPGRLDEYSYPIAAAEMNRFQRPGNNPDEPELAFGYAYQFDSSLYARVLRQYAEANGVVRTEGKVLETILDPENGFVRRLKLSGERVIDADLFIDCSGFRGVLIEQALQTGYDDWSRWLPCDRAVAVPCENRGALSPFTRATARTGGWQWRIPLQHRTGNGHVYASAFLSDDEAVRQLMENLDGPALAEPRPLRFTAGRRNLFWNRNVVAVGLSGGFLEPLESTSIHLIQEAITELLARFPDRQFCQADIDEYNRAVGLQFERVRDFLLLHYVATQRDDTEMWRYFRAMALPDSLEEKIRAWTGRGHVVRYEFGLFLPPSWIAVMLGQNLIPQGYDPRADVIDGNALSNDAGALRRKVARAAARTPDHAAFLRQAGAWAGPAPAFATAS